MTEKLTVHVDESLKRLIKETSGNRKISDVVSDALESYLAAGSIKVPNLPGKVPVSELPSLSEVRSRRPKVTGSSAEMIASQRRDRNARLS
jgi:hypothetical protein